jgi:hypothetical protein
MSTTTAPVDCLCGAIALDVTATRYELSAARVRLSQKDSPGNRASVAECWARIDALLDMLLEADGGHRRAARWP